MSNENENNTTGATGMIGEGVLLGSLDPPDITGVIKPLFLLIVINLILQNLGRLEKESLFYFIKLVNLDCQHPVLISREVLHQLFSTPAVREIQIVHHLVLKASLIFDPVGIRNF